MNMKLVVTLTDHKQTITQRLGRSARITENNLSDFLFYFTF